MASVEDATPAKAEAAVQIWPGPLPATVTHFPGRPLFGRLRPHPPGTPDVYCDAASLLLRAPRLLRLTLVVAIVLSLAVVRLLVIRQEEPGPLR